MTQFAGRNRNDPRRYERQCRGKVPYASKGKAGGILRVMRNRGAGPFLHVYHCPVCKKWHLGNRNG